MPTIKFGKHFAEFMISIALLKEFGSYEFVTIIEVLDMRRCSGKANKLRYIHIPKDIAIKERKINNKENHNHSVYHIFL